MHVSIHIQSCIMYACTYMLYMYAYTCAHVHINIHAHICTYSCTLTQIHSIENLHTHRDTRTDIHHSILQKVATVPKCTFLILICSFYCNFFISNETRIHMHTFRCAHPHSNTCTIHKYKDFVLCLKYESRVSKDTFLTWGGG